MTLNVDEGRNSTAADSRQAVTDDLLDELTSWPPRDRVGMFKEWQRGALSVVHLHVLAQLEAIGPLSMSRLAEALDVSDASATGIVDRMERNGFVERRHATDDRRLVLVHVTERGAGVFRELASHRRERLAVVLAQLSEQELAGFLVGVRAMRAARERLFGTPGHGRLADGERDCPPSLNATPGGESTPA